MRVNPFNRKYFGTGGNENDLKIWSIDQLTKLDKDQRKPVIFQAKNVHINCQPAFIHDEMQFRYLFFSGSPECQFGSLICNLSMNEIDVSLRLDTIKLDIIFIYFVSYFFLILRSAFTILNRVLAGRYTKQNSSNIRSCLSH